MAFIHGRTAVLSIDGTAITAYTDQATLDKMAELAEVTSFGDDDKAFIGGLKGATISASGSWDAAADAAIVGCFDGAVVAFSLTVGAIAYTGNALVTGYTITAGVGDKVSWSCSLTVSGAVGRA